MGEKDLEDLKKYRRNVLSYNLESRETFTGVISLIDAAKMKKKKTEQTKTLIEKMKKLEQEHTKIPAKI